MSQDRSVPASEVAASPPPPGPARPDGLLATAAQHGALTWTARRCFTLLGGWSQTLADPEAKVLAAVAAQQHAWHGDLWFARLPQLREVDVEALVAAPEGVPAVFEALDGLDGDVAKLTGLARILLPRLVVGLRAHRARLSEVADGPSVRSARFVLADLAEQRDGFDATLTRLIDDEAVLATAVAAAAAVERRCIEAPLLAGGQLPTSGAAR